MSQESTCGQGCRDNEDASRTSRNNLTLEIDAFELDLDLASSVDGHRQISARQAVDRWRVLAGEGNEPYAFSPLPL